MNVRLHHRRFARRFGRDRRGAAQIEFVLSILTVMFVLFGIWECVMVVYTLNVLSDAAKEGVRYAIVHGSRSVIPSGPGNTAAVESVVRDWAKASFRDVSSTTMTVTVSYLYTDPVTRVQTVENIPGSIVTVNVSCQFLPYTAVPIKPILNTVSAGVITF